MFEKEVSYSKIVALIRKQINQVRVNPISFSGYLNSHKARFDAHDPLIFYPLIKAKELCVKTKQGFKGTFLIQQRKLAVQELDKFLLRQSACQQLKWSYDLHLIAHKKAARLAKSQTSMSTQDAVQQILEMAEQQRQKSRKQFESHIMTKNSKGIQKMRSTLRQGVQIILDDQYYFVYYGVIDPKQLVSKILIDDGFPNRQHRKALLSKRMNHIGIGIHEHQTQCFVVVIILANHVKQITHTNEYLESTCECKLI